MAADSEKTGDKQSSVHEKRKEKIETALKESADKLLAETHDTGQGKLKAAESAKRSPELEQRKLVGQLNIDIPGNSKLLRLPFPASPLTLENSAKAEQKPELSKTANKPDTGITLRPERLAPLDLQKRAKFDRSFAELQEKIESGELKANPKGIVAIHKNGGEIYDEDKLKWAISRPAEGKVPDVAANDMPFTGRSTLDAGQFLAVLKKEGSIYANKREDINVRLHDGTVSKVSLDMGQLAKLYEVKWSEQGNMNINAAALLAQSYHEINTANLQALAQTPGILGKAAVERTEQTNQWAGIKTGKNTFRCEADEKNWGQINPKWGEKLSPSVWADKKETRAWDTPGKAMCGWFEHIGEKYVANGKDTAGKIIPLYVGAGAGAAYIEGFANEMQKLGKMESGQTKQDHSEGNSAVEKK